jgi:hypothetical protein
VTGHEGMPATVSVMTAEAYHADPAPEPSLSSSIANILISESPRHAWAAHPRLGRAEQEEPDEKYSARAVIGSAAHKLALGAGADITVLDFDHFRTKASQEARDAATGIVILGKHYEQAKALAVDLEQSAAEYMGAPIKDCLTERVIIWQEPNGIWCRAMIDLMTPDYRRMCDIKTTQASVSPEACARRVYEGYHVQDAFYRRAGDALEPADMGKRSFGFIFAEQSSPYAVSPPIELSEAGQSLGRTQVERAIALWGKCISAGQWPGFSREIHIAEPPSWVLQKEGVE